MGKIVCPTSQLINGEPVFRARCESFVDDPRQGRLTQSSRLISSTKWTTLSEQLSHIAHVGGDNCSRQIALSESVRVLVPKQFTG